MVWLDDALNAMVYELWMAGFRKDDSRIGDLGRTHAVSRCESSQGLGVHSLCGLTRSIFVEANSFDSIEKRRPPEVVVLGLCLKN